MILLPVGASGGLAGMMLAPVPSCITAATDRWGRRRSCS
jgi:hypothetical protein